MGCGLGKSSIQREKSPPYLSTSAAVALKLFTVVEEISNLEESKAALESRGMALVSTFQQEKALKKEPETC
jgi:hypothetical protein